MTDFEVALIGLITGLFIWTTYLHVKLFSFTKEEKEVDLVEVIARLEGRQQETLTAVSSIQQVLIALTKPKL